MSHTYFTVVIRDLAPGDVTSGTLGTDRGYVDLIPGVTIHGTIAGLRAVAVEIDRQLARLEVEHRIDQATTKCGTCAGTGEVAVQVAGEFDEIGVCPDCGGTGQ